MNIVIENGHLVDPKNGIDTTVSIYIQNKKIAAIGKKPKGFVAKKIINANGQYVFPGLVDLCARMREPGEEHKATIESETHAAVKAGITHLVCPPDTHPIIDTPAMAHMVRDRAIEHGYAIIHPLGALTIGLKGEQLTDMLMMHEAGCVGVGNATQTIENTLVMRRAMQYAATYNIPVFLMPKDKWLQGNGVIHEGYISTRLGLPAIPEATETVGIARDIALIETSGATAHFELISCGRSVTMLSEAQKRKLPVTAGVAIHQLLYNEHDVGIFDTNYKVMPPFRTEKDRKSLIKGIKSGVISVICSNHQPHGNDVKLAPFSDAAVGISGLDTLLTLSFDLVRNSNLPLTTVIAALTTNPASIINIDAGDLSVGSNADLCLFDPQQRWKLCPQTMNSRGKNTPLLDQDLQGKVTLTMINGKILTV